MNKEKQIGYLVAFQVFFVGAIYMALAFWTDRSLDFWVSHFKGETVDVPLWISFVVALLNGATFGFNIIAEIVRYFV